MANDKAFVTKNGLTSLSDVDVTGNIIVSGTVDGRDLATDGSKLDGISASATVGIITQEEGVNVLTAPTTMNFVGTNVTVTDVGGVATITVSAGVGDVAKVGTPVDNQVGVWTGDGTIEGTTGLTYDGSALGITGNITLTGTVDGRDLVTDGTKLDGIATGATVGIAVQEEGGSILTAPTTMNFVGSPVTVTDVGGVATVTVAIPPTSSPTESVDYARAYRSGSVQVLTGAYAFDKLEFNTIASDTTGMIDTTTNVGRVTPTKPGYYMITCNIRISADKRATFAVHKNGAIDAYVGTSEVTTRGPAFSHLIYMNGTTDYFEVFFQIDTTANLETGANFTHLEVVGPLGAANTGGAAPLGADPTGVFDASLSASQVDVTGDGSSAIVLWNTVDAAQDFVTLDTGTGIATFNKAGVYFIESQVRVLKAGGVATLGTITLYAGGTALKQAQVDASNGEQIFTMQTGGFVSVNIGDTAYVQCSASGDTKTYDFIANATQTYFRITRISLNSFLGTVDKYVYTATASQTAFSGADDNADILAFSADDVVSVYLNGALLIETENYTLNATTDVITLTTGATVDDEIQITVLKAMVNTITSDITGAVAGEILTYDGTNWVNAQPDTSGSIYGKELISTHDLSVALLSTGNELDIDVSLYSEITVLVNNAAIASGSTLEMRVSADNGFTFRSVSGDYVRNYITDTGGQLVTNTTAIYLAGGAAGTTSLNGDHTITGFNNASAPLHHIGHAGSNNDSYFMAGYTSNLEAVNAVRFISGDGTAFTAGRLTIWGVRRADANTFFGDVNKYVYTATAGQTVFSGADDNTNVLAFGGTDPITVHLNGGLLIETTDYTLTAATNTITLTSGVALDDEIQITVITASLALVDADITTPADGEVLVYSSGTNNWVNQSPNVERTYRATLTLTAESTKDWAIPANCVRLTVNSANLNAGLGDSQLYLRLLKASDGLQSLQDRMSVGTANSVTTSYVNLGSTVLVNQRVHSTVATRKLGVCSEILNPRDAAKKTTSKSRIICDGDEITNDTIYESNTVAVTAEDHDTFRIMLQDGDLMTGDLEIEYTVVE